MNDTAMSDTAGVFMLVAATGLFLLVSLLYGFAHALGMGRYRLRPAVVTLALTTGLLFGVFAAVHG